MKKYFKLIFWIVLILVGVPTFLNAQQHDFFCGTNHEELDHTGQNNGGGLSYNGKDHTPRGDMKMLIVFVGFKGYLNPIQSPIGNWDGFGISQEEPTLQNNYGLPGYLKFEQNGSYTMDELLFNEPFDFDESNPNSSVNILDNRSVSKALYYASRSNPDRTFRLMGEPFTDPSGRPVLIVLDPQEIIAQGTPGSFSDLDKLVYKKMQEINPNFDYSRFDNRTNKPVGANFTIDNADTVPDYTLNPENKPNVDFTGIIYRFSSEWSQLPFTGMASWIGASGGQYPNAPDDAGIIDKGFRITRNGGESNDVFLHEFAHGIWGATHYMGANGETNGNSIKQINTGIGAMGNAVEMMDLQLNAWERWYLDYIDPYYIEEGEETFEIGDFNTTGDAIRIKIPFSNKDSRTGHHQHLWIENHTGISIFDDSPAEGIPVGPGNITLPNCDYGVYMYVEDMSESHTNLLTSDANGGCQMVNASGNWDFKRHEDISTNNYNGEFFLFERKQSNPLDGINPWLRFFEINDGASFQEQFPMEAKISRELGVPTQGSFIYRDAGGFNPNYSSYARSPAFSTGDELNMGTNPSILNYTTTTNEMNGELQILTQTPYYLNGLSVKIESVNSATGKAIIKVKYKTTTVKQNVRWAGANINLEDITDDSNADLIVDKQKEITIDKSELYNSSSFIFAPPLFERNEVIADTKFTIKKNAKLQLEESAVIRIKNHSTMIIEEGAEVILKDKACIFVEETGTLDLRGNNIKLLGNDATIIVKGKLITDDGVDFTFDGSGYVEFHDTHTLELGEGSAFVLDGEGKGHRFMRLRENTQLNINDRFISLKNGEVRYYEGSEIYLSNEGQANFISTEFEGLSAINTKGIVANQFSRLTINECDFHDLFRGAEMSESPNIFVGLFEIRNSEFTNNITSIYGYDLDYIRILNSEIIGGECGAVFKNMRAVNFFNTKVSGISNIPEEGNIFSGAVRLQDVQRMLIKGGNIFGNNTGICSKPKSLANILLTDDATIEGNVIGIEIYGLINNQNNVDGGGVVIDCSNVINNDFGIYGIDVTLDIDASQSHIGSNDFDHTEKQYIFWIEYEAKPIPSPPIVPAYLNYWGEKCPPTNYSIANGLISLGTEPSPQCEALKFSCERKETPIPPQDECDERLVRDPDILIQDQYSTAFLNFWEDKEATAEKLFYSVAEISSNDIRNSICEEKIQLARTMVNVNNEQMGLKINKEGESVNTNQDNSKILLDESKDNPKDISIYPNPAKGQFVIELPEGVYRFELINSFGQLLMQRELNKTATFSTENLGKGIYFIHVYEMNLQQKFEQKLIVE